MIKFEHSVFALPFALTAALLAARYSLGVEWPTGRQILWIVVAMVERVGRDDRQSHRGHRIRSP